MLRGISPLLSPDLLAALCRMGHGDTIVLADAHFPAESCGTRVLRADGLRIVPLLEAVLPLFVLDHHTATPVILMEAAEGDVADPAVETSYLATLRRFDPKVRTLAKVDRFAFYDLARKSFAVIATGDTATYANIILTKGVTPVEGDTQATS